MICETVSTDGTDTALDLGQLDMMVDEYRQNFVPVDQHITEMNKDNW